MNIHYMGTQVPEWNWYVAYLQNPDNDKSNHCGTGDTYEKAVRDLERDVQDNYVP